MTPNSPTEPLLPSAEQRRKVYISYSHHDESQARKLIASLEATGHECWIDNSDIKGGDKWVKAIVEGLNNSDTVNDCRRLNQVELWFAKVERDVIARGVFTSVTDPRRKLMIRRPCASLILHPHQVG